MILKLNIGILWYVWIYKKKINFKEIVDINWIVFEICFDIGEVLDVNVMIIIMLVYGRYVLYGRGFGYFFFFFMEVIIKNIICRII